MSMNTLIAPTLNYISVGMAFTNTLVRLMPVGLYTGSAIGGLLFSDTRGAILFAGFLINEAISYGYRMILQGIYNPQCALMKTDNDFFVLPSPITQTFGFFYGFIMSDMYNKGEFIPATFFFMTVMLLLVIYSRVNVGCKTMAEALYCSLLGMLLGAGYYYIIKDYYKADAIKLNISDAMSGLLPGSSTEEVKLPTN